MPDTTEFSRVLFLAVDAWRYSARDGRQQHDLQEALDGALSWAAEESGLDRSTWLTQPAGDGLLALLPESGAEPKLVDAFVRELDVRLSRYNHDRVPEARLRLRMAVHHGVAVQAKLGFAAHGAVHVSRLCDAREVRAALDAAPEANLVLAVSQPIYEDLVCQRLTSLSPADFTRVDVADEKKGFHTTAWIRVPGARPDLAPAEVLALGLRFENSPYGYQEFFERVVNGSFAAASLPPPEDVRSVGDELSIHLPAGTSGTRVLGVWLDQLYQALRTHAPRLRMAVGVALGPDPAAAGREASALAAADPATGVLAAAPAARLVVVVSDHVHRTIVSPGGRMILPENYRAAPGVPAAWLRVPGHAIPPAPGPAPEPPRAGLGGGVVNSHTGTVHGAIVQAGTINVGGNWNQNDGRRP